MAVGGNGNNGANHVDDIRDLEARYRHMDDRVGKIGQEVAGVKATLDSVVSTLETISKRVNQPNNTQWSPIIAAIGLAFTVAMAFTAMTARPIESQLDRVSDRQAHTLEVGMSERVEHARTMGALEAMIAREQEENIEDDNTQSKIMEKIYDINYRLGRIEGAKVSQ